MKLCWVGLEDADAVRILPPKIEAMGFDTIAVTELQHDPFVRAAVLTEHTKRVEIMTSVAIALSRTPMLLAAAAHDLNALSGGRFVLGLGSQTKPHITRRFSMPWTQPAERMKEMIRAIHAIWDCWYDGKPLKFEGQFYSHTLMTPAFSPTDTQFGRPPIHMAAVGPLMTEAAAEVADGLVCHVFTTERYVREVTLPAVEATLARYGRSRAEFEITGVPFVATGRDAEAQEAARIEAKRRIAFYGSTPAYQAVLDLHGWGALHQELHRLSRQGRWDDMGGLIDDEIFETFAIVGTPEEAAVALKHRFGDVFDRISFGLGNDMEAAAQLYAALRS